MIDQFTADPLAPDDQFNPLNLRYKRKLSSLVGATGSPGASTLGSFSPDDDQSWGGSRFYGSLPDEAAFNVSSAGAAGQGVSGQPEVVRNKPPEPRAPAGKVLAAKMPPPGIPAQLPVTPESVGSAAPPTPVQSQPQSAPSTPQSTPPAGAADQFSSQAQQVAQRMAARKPPEMKTNWAQRLGLAVLSVSRLAPYAQQIVHPKWAAETAQYNTAQAQDVKQLEALEKGENISALREQRAGTAEWRKAQAEDLKAREEERKRLTEERGTAAQQTDWSNRLKLLMKGRETDTAYLPENSPQVAQLQAHGYQIIKDRTYKPDPNEPGQVIAIPPAMIQVTKDMLPYHPGMQEGDLVPWSEHKSALADFAKRQQDSAKPNAQQMNAVSLAIRAAGGDPNNPESVTPEIAAKASAILKPQMPGTNLTPDAVRFWAEAAARGIPLPSLGMGGAGALAREKILNAAPGVAGNQPLVANRAVQRADTASLSKMVGMRDAVVSFEKTASKNLDLFLNTAKPIVDSGSPWLNTPLRKLNLQGLGGEDLAAYNAARQVALTEIAKVVNNPSLSSVLSDTARREVLSLSPDNATLGQIYRIANVLKQDMANRRQSLDDQIKEVKGRLGGTTPAGSPAKVVWTRDASGKPVPMSQ